MILKRLENCYIQWLEGMCRVGWQTEKNYIIFINYVCLKSYVIYGRHLAK